MPTKERPSSENVIKGPWRLSAYEKEVEQQLGYCAVALIGTNSRVPRDWGDNQGAWPIRFAVTENPQRIAQHDDLASPLHPVEVQAFVWCESKDAAWRFKGKLEEMVATRADPLRHRWYDVEPWEVEVLFRDAAEAATVAVFDETERRRRVLAAINRRIAKEKQAWRR